MSSQVNDPPQSEVPLSTTQQAANDIAIKIYNSLVNNTEIGVKKLGIDSDLIMPNEYIKKIDLSDFLSAEHDITIPEFIETMFRNLKDADGKDVVKVTDIADKNEYTVTVLPNPAGNQENGVNQENPVFDFPESGDFDKYQDLQNVLELIIPRLTKSQEPPITENTTIVESGNNGNVVSEKPQIPKRDSSSTFVNQVHRNNSGGFFNAIT